MGASFMLVLATAPCNFSDRFKNGRRLLRPRLQKTPMQLVASLKKFVEATEINFDDAFCNREDIDAFIGGLNVIMEHA